MTMRRGPKVDTLPELTRYHDDGCDLHPACLTCPFAACRYDTPNLPPPRVVIHAAILRAFNEEHLTAKELTVRFNTPKRTVHRILATARRERTSATTKA